MNIKRAVFMAVLVVAIAALALPLVGLRAAASGSVASSRAATSARKAAAAKASTANAAPQQLELQREAPAARGDDSSAGQISADTLKTLGITRAANPREASAKIGQMLQSRLNKSQKGTGDVSIQSGEPLLLDGRSALSDAFILALGGRDNQFSEVTLIADWDGREDCAADREQKVDDFSFAESEIDVELTRTAISEHTVANGFNENVYYYGDSVGNLWVGTDINPGLPGVNGVGPTVNTSVPNNFGAQVDSLRQVFIPNLVNLGTAGGFTLVAPGGAAVGGTATSGDCLDDQVVVTGIAVNPVADLGDFSQALCGVIGEVVYVSVLDTEGCTRNSSGQPLRTRIFAFAFTDVAGGLAPAGAIQILRSKFSDIAGVAVDDDGSLYYQLIDLIQLSGGALLKATELCRTVQCAAAMAPEEVSAQVATTRINRVIPSIPDPPTLGSWVGTTANPVVTSGGSRHTNYGGGSSGTFGNIVAIASGPCNVLYAAVARSFVAGAVSFEQLTEGLFTAPTQFTAGTPSMVISFADCSGAFDACSGQAVFIVNPDDPNLGGVLPVADGFADVANATVTTRIAGVNNFRIFVEGNGPDLRNPVSLTVPSTPASVLQVDMQIDYVPAHAGITVTGEGAVFVISGGAPAGVGKSPSPMLGEILCFEDSCPADRRGDFVDLRGNTVPNPPASGGNVGDGDSDRFDHIFYQSPIDVNTATPAGLTGVAHGFLRYTNRLAPNAMGTGVTLGQTGGPKVLGLNSTTSAAVIFEWLDPGHQVAGGDDQNTPNRGDDSDTVPGTTAVSSPAIGVVPNASVAGTETRNGGFEFLFGGPVTSPNCVWNGFFWNSNGNITFGAGDTSSFANVPSFRQGLPKIAPAWAKLDPGSRDQEGLLCTFPVMALGYVNVNAFEIRWINVPEEDPTGSPLDHETCVVNSTNTFSVTLYDDGVGVDENTTETLSPTATIGNNVNDGAAVFDQFEGPTDLRFTREPITGTLVGCNPRPEGSGIFTFEYCRMDLLGTNDRPVLTGYSIGGTSPFNTGLNPPGLCGTNLSEAAKASDGGSPFGTLAGATSSCSTLTGGEAVLVSSCQGCCIGEGTEPTIFELFNGGNDASIGAGGEIFFARPCFDLRFEGNDAALCTSLRQKDNNRGHICFVGIGCNPPANPQCLAVVIGPFVTPPGVAGQTGSTGLVNAICSVKLNLVGCGFFPNEVTTICSGFANETGQLIQRPGKTVTTAAVLLCDTNGDTVVDATIVLGSVQPVNCNLVTATLNTLATLPGTAFPAACCGGTASIVVTTTFTVGDNNAFGAFTRQPVIPCSVNLGTRAPVVFSATPASGACGVCQDLLITGACFTFTQAVPGGDPIIGNVTSVFAVAADGTRVNATNFQVLNAQLIDALFCFGSANAGKTFFIFVVGPGGVSRNLGPPQVAPAGTPAGTACNTGNEQGIQVTFTCSSSTAPPVCPGPDPRCGTPVDQALVNGCKLDRNPAGNFILDVFGKNLKPDADVRVGSITPKVVKAREPDPSFPGGFLRITLKGRICNGLPGTIVVTNPPAAPGGPTEPSQPFACTETCAAN